MITVNHTIDGQSMFGRSPALNHGHNNSGSDDGTFSLQVYGGGRIRWHFGDGFHWAVQAYPASTTTSLLDGLWHQITLVRRRSGASSADLELWIAGRNRDQLLSYQHGINVLEFLERFPKQ